MQDNVNFIYADPYIGSNYNSVTDPRRNHYLQIGADNGCKFAFLK